jgi:hypothetical protein
VSRANYERVQVGMTQDEVLALLGNSFTSPHVEVGPPCWLWEGDGFTVEV